VIVDRVFQAFTSGRASDFKLEREKKRDISTQAKIWLSQVFLQGERQPLGKGFKIWQF